MSDLAKDIYEAIDITADVGGDLEMTIEERPGVDMAANRLRLKNVIAIDGLFQKAMKLAVRSGV